jgi:hypothetical protein
MSTTRVKNITIDSQPLCARELDRAKDDPQRSQWLADAAIQRAIYALDAELKPFTAALVGTAIDHGSRTALVVFDTSFNDYEAVRARLLDKVEPLNIALSYR